MCISHLASLTNSQYNYTLCPKQPIPNHKHKRAAVA